MKSWILPAVAMLTGLAVPITEASAASWSVRISIGGHSRSVYVQREPVYVERWDRTDWLIHVLLTARHSDDRRDAAKELDSSDEYRVLEALEYAAKYDDSRSVRREAERSANRVRANIRARELLYERRRVIVQPPVVHHCAHGHAHHLCHTCRSMIIVDPLPPPVIVRPPVVVHPVPPKPVYQPPIKPPAQPPVHQPHVVRPPVPAPAAPPYTRGPIPPPPLVPHTRATAPPMR